MLVNYLAWEEYQKNVTDSDRDKSKSLIFFEHTNGLYYYALQKNGEVLMHSQAFLIKSQCVRSSEQFLERSLNANNYKSETTDGKHYLILLNDLGIEFTRSKPFSNELDCDILLDDLTQSEKSSQIGILQDPIAQEIEKNEPLDIQIEQQHIEINEAKPIVFQSNLPYADDLSKAENSFKQDAEEIIENKAELFDRTSPRIDQNNLYKASEQNEFLTTQFEPIEDDLKVLGEDQDIEPKRNWIKLALPLLIIGSLVVWLLQFDGISQLQNIIHNLSQKNTDSIETIEDKPKGGNEELLITPIASTGDQANTLRVRLLDGSLIIIPENGTEKKLLDFILAKCGSSDIKKTWFEFDRIRFKAGSAFLDESSDEQIQLVAKIFKSYPNKKFKIGGYTDNVGDPEENILLSANRAENAMKRLVFFGADSLNMRFEGYGSAHPLCPENNTIECRARNSRIAIRVDVCK